MCWPETALCGAYSAGADSGDLGATLHRGIRDAEKVDPPRGREPSETLSVRFYAD